MKLVALFAVALAVAAPASAQSFLNAYQTKVRRLSTAIDQSPLNADLKLDFRNKLNKIHLGACNGTGGVEAYLAVEATHCGDSSASKIEDANDKIDSLGDALNDAIKQYGKKDMRQLYGPKVAALKTKIEGAKSIDANDKKALNERIRALSDLLAAPNTPAEKVDDTLQKLSDDVDAAIALSAEKGESVGFLNAFAAAQKKLKTKIETSKLAKPLQDDFTAQLNAIEQGACHPNAKSGDQEVGVENAARVGLRDCHGTPSSLEKAQDAQNALSDAVDAAIKTDGTKSLVDIYAPKVAALQAKIKAANIDKTDSNALTAEFTDFNDGLNGKGWGAAIKRGADAAVSFDDLKRRQKDTEDLVQKAADKFQKLSDDVDAAVALSKEKGESVGFATKLLSDVEALKSKVNATKLDQAFKTDFLRRIDQIKKDACTPKDGSKDASGKGAWADGGARGFTKPADCKTSASLVETAETALSQVSDDLAAAVTADGTKTLAEIYKPKLDALTKQLDGSTISADNRKPLDERIKNFNDAVAKAVAKSGSPRQSGRGLSQDPKLLKATEDTVQAASDLFDKLSADVAAAIKLSPIADADAKVLIQKLTALKTTITGSALKASDSSPLARRADELTSKLRMTVGSRPNSDDANDAYNALVADYQSALAAAAAAKPTAN